MAPLNVFRERGLPEPAALAGYAALISQHELEIPLPPRLAAIAQAERRTVTDSWQVLERSRAPRDTLAGHLEFALKWEGVDLLVLDALFRMLPDAEIESVVRSKPTGMQARRLWYLFEWLTGRTLDVPDAGPVRAVPAIDPERQHGLAHGVRSTRHRVIDNLPGTPDFCPLVRRSKSLDSLAARVLGERARAVISRTHPDLIARAAAFLLLSDSRASFAIEREQPAPERARRWAQAIAAAGRIALSIDELERLQRLVIGNDRFVRLGLRAEGGFVGAHDRQSGMPLPDHVSARPEDLRGLVSGIVAYVERAAHSGMDPIVTAAASSFGLVFVHPFEDGNGRIHRWMIHHVLASQGIHPPGFVLPVSAAILRRIDDYRSVLEATSHALLPYIDWRPTARGNVEVRNQTAPLYKYFDATAHAEFLAGCVAETIDTDLPREVSYLQAFDAFSARLKVLIEMPDRLVALLHRFLIQGGGRLSRRGREGEFAALTDAEVAAVEQIHEECFGGMPEDHLGAG